MDKTRFREWRVTRERWGTYIYTTWALQKLQLRYADPLPPSLSRLTACLVGICSSPSLTFSTRWTVGSPQVRIRLSLKRSRHFVRAYIRVLQTRMTNVAARFYKCYRQRCAFKEKNKNVRLSLINALVSQRRTSSFSTFSEQVFSVENAPPLLFKLLAKIEIKNDEFNMAD